ncbi:hypothetical protein [Persephonella sp. IF05-L8]|uniref:hypothetical protein n=1 Tax=Persephonella sp. IF05-L8 TaxID=1158338 RepID=UPI000495A597
MKKYLWSIYLFFIAFLSAYGQELSQLLKKYSCIRVKNTEDRTLGPAYIFTREELENLQIHTLADLLRLLPHTSYLPNRYGVESLNMAGLKIDVPTYVRLFIDDHEVSSIYTLSPFLIYDEYPIANVDFVKVYYAGMNTKLSYENGPIVIKLYTKEPDKENISFVKGIYDSKKSYNVIFSDAKQLSSDFSYFVMLSKGEKKFSKLYLNGNNLNRNQRRVHAYFKIKYKDLVLQFSGSKVHRGIWGGFSFDFSPDYGYVNSTDIFMSAKFKTLEDKSLEFFVSYDQQRRKSEEKNNNFINVPNAYNETLGYPIYIYDRRDLKKTVLSTRKKFDFKQNNLYLGVDFRNYNQKARENLQYVSAFLQNVKPFYIRYINIYSIFAEESHRFTDNFAAYLSLKFEKYDWDKNRDHLDENWKIGVSYKIKDFTFKVFAFSIFIPPSMLNVETSPEKKLKPYKISSQVLSIDYIPDKKKKLSLHIRKISLKNPIIFFPQFNGYINVPVKEHGNMYILEYSQKFYRNKLRAYFWTFNKDKFGYYSPRTGANLIWTGNIKNWSYFITFLYKKNIKVENTYIPDAYNLSLGVSYSTKSGWNFQIKGENLLNRGEKVFYAYLGGNGLYSGIDRRYTVSIQKEF